MTKRKDNPNPAAAALAALRAPRPRVTLTCAVCGTAFDGVEYHDPSAARTCSNKCRQQLKRRKAADAG